VAGHQYFSGITIFMYIGKKYIDYFVSLKIKILLVAHLTMLPSISLLSAARRLLRLHVGHISPGVGRSTRTVRPHIAHGWMISTPACLKRLISPTAVTFLASVATQPPDQSSSVLYRPATTFLRVLFGPFCFASSLESCLAARSGYVIAQHESHRARALKN
jgi:hypothetical protein